jgi:hypothetical protein
MKRGIGSEQIGRQAIIYLNVQKSVSKTMMEQHVPYRSSTITISQ